MLVINKLKDNVNFTYQSFSINSANINQTLISLGIVSTILMIERPQQTPFDSEIARMIQDSLIPFSPNQQNAIWMLINAEYYRDAII